MPINPEQRAPIRVSPAMAELRGEHAKQITLLKARHQNEEIDLMEKQRAEYEELAKREAPSK